MHSFPQRSWGKMMESAPSGSRLLEFGGIGHAPALMANDQIEAVEEFLLSD